MRRRRLSGRGGRPLNFTVRPVRHLTLCFCVAALVTAAAYSEGCATTSKAGRAVATLKELKQCRKDAARDCPRADVQLLQLVPISQLLRYLGPPDECRRSGVEGTPVAPVNGRCPTDSVWVWSEILPVQSLNGGDTTLVCTVDASDRCVA